MCRLQDSEEWVAEAKCPSQCCVDGKCMSEKAKCGGSGGAVILWCTLGVTAVVCCGGIAGIAFLLRSFFEKGGRPDKAGLLKAAGNPSAMSQKYAQVGR
mmetsp:Transcript_44609/g.68258  ORF Transcript_44609/g.68258 Transcript_44609/m.68258 type:complete len:99 (+) Transcript_44609:1-297(+)